MGGQKERERYKGRSRGDEGEKDEGRGMTGVKRIY